jgi:3-oxoacyl-[acyl-carrier-protein] synthase-3
VEPIKLIKTGNVSIEAVACELAPNIIKSSDIEERLSGTMQRLEIPQGLLEGLTGISERRFRDTGIMWHSWASAAD